MSFKTVTVLGSTGSVGQNTLDLLKFHKDKFKVVALTAYKNSNLLIEQALLFQPDIVAIGDETQIGKVKSALASTSIKILAGADGILEAASLTVDITVAAIVGMSGLKPLMAAIGNARTIAVANKEPLVAAGALFLKAAEEANTKILPLDSEHNAIFQVFENQNRSAISKLILTASGGPFRTWSKEEMASATPEQAVAHPNWSMGAKISVDSATMMNKGLEVIEAHHLFQMPASKIEVLLHPQSVVHSMVEYKDGSVLAQLGAPDMRTPIAYALGWPDRIETSGQRLDFSAMKQLEFSQVDFIKFPCLKLAYEALESGQSACIAMNSANEIAVEAFLNRKISFGQIFELIMKMLDRIQKTNLSSLDEIINFDRENRINALEMIQ